MVLGKHEMSLGHSSLKTRTNDGYVHGHDGGECEAYLSANASRCRRTVWALTLTGRGKLSAVASEKHPRAMGFPHLITPPLRIPLGFCVPDDDPRLGLMTRRSFRQR